MLAIMGQAPELMLDEKEAAALAKASLNVARYYTPLEVSGLAGAWTSLLFVVLMIYGQRLFAIVRRKKRETPIEGEFVQEPLKEAA